MRSNLADPPAGRNAGAPPSRAAVATIHPAGPGHPVLPPSRRPLAAIQADPRLSNGARRLAAHLDGRCLAPGKWAAWPKVSTIAYELGWGGDPRAFRKRVGRYFRELIGSGDVARPRLGELVAWHDAEGAAGGFDWPRGLRRGLCRSAAICVLGWKLAEAEGRLPSLTPCDIPVAPKAPTAPAAADPAPSNVACDPPGMSHGDPPGMSHPQNVRSLNVQSELTLDAVAVTAGGEGSPPMPTEPPAAVATAAAPDRSRTIEAERLASELLRARDLRPAVADAATPGAITFRVPPGRGPLPDAAELSAIARLWPEFLQALASRGFKVPRPTPTPLAGEGSGRPAAAKVPPGVRASARAAVARLAVPGATNGDVLAATRALVSALGPHRDHDVTVATFHRLCGRVRKGAVAEAVVQDAFEAACGRKVEGRGALFVALVKRALAPSGARGCPPG